MSNIPLSKPTAEILLRFTSKISNTPTEKGCLEWIAGGHNKRPAGSYGVFSLEGKTVFSHRVAFEWLKGEVLEEGMCVRHTCDNPRCCNPDHLIQGTHADNMRDRSERKRCNPVIGDSHYSRTNPELLNAPRGDNHYTRRNPDMINKGDKLGKVTRLPDSEVPKLKQDLAQGMRNKDAAAKYNLSPAQVSAIKYGKYRKDL